MSAFKTIAVAKEIESPENPGALEKRVALIPSDVKKLVDHGVRVSVETGAGDGVAVVLLRGGVESAWDRDSCCGFGDELLLLLRLLLVRTPSRCGCC